MDKHLEKIKSAIELSELRKKIVMDKILDEAEKRVERMASEYAYRQTDGISDKNVQSVTFLMIKDNIVRGSRMMREAINDLNKKNHEQETVREGYEY